MRLIVALFLIVASELGIRALDHGLMSPVAPTLSKPLDELPLSMGPWAGHKLELDPRLFEGAGSASIVNRAYQNPMGDEVSVSIAVWLKYEPIFPHRPELCYANAGWDIRNRKTVTIAPSTGPEFPARILTLEKNGAQITLLYWAQYGTEYAFSDNDVRLALQKYRGLGGRRPAGIKVMLQTAAASSEQAERRLLDVAGLLEPQIDSIAK